LFSRGRIVPELQMKEKLNRYWGVEHLRRILIPGRKEKGSISTKKISKAGEKKPNHVCHEGTLALGLV